MVSCFQSENKHETSLSYAPIYLMFIDSVIAPKICLNTYSDSQLQDNLVRRMKKGNQYILTISCLYEPILKRQSYQMSINQCINIASIFIYSCC